MSQHIKHVRAGRVYEAFVQSIANGTSQILFYTAGGCHRRMDVDAEGNHIMTMCAVGALLSDADLTYERMMLEDDTDVNGISVVDFRTLRISWFSGVERLQRIHDNLVNSCEKPIPLRLVELGEALDEWCEEAGIIPTHNSVIEKVKAAHV